MPGGLGSSGGGGAGNAGHGSNGTFAGAGGAGGTGNPGSGGGQGAGYYANSTTFYPANTPQQYGGGGGGAYTSQPTRQVGAQGYVLITYTVSIVMNSSGPISLGGTGTTGDSVNLRLGNSATATITMNDAAVRTLTSTSSGATIIMPTNFYGK